MTTLAVDTSSKACSCALVRGGTLLAECYLNVGLTHSATLMRLVGDTLGHAGLGPGAVDRLAVTVGPGSYTGLRIGMAAVKGMALAGDLPCVGVSTLLSLAYNLLCFEGTVCVALDARVGQVFAALFSVRGGEVSRLTEDAAMTLEELGRILPEGAMVCGDGTELVCRAFGEAKRLRPAPAALRFQRASSAALAAEGLSEVPASALTVAYHRLSQAERERAARERQSGDQ